MLADLLELAIRIVVTEGFSHGLGSDKDLCIVVNFEQTLRVKLLGFESGFAG